MADVRALLAAEKSSRRITHHHANYTKSGVLTCTACDLTIRSEALWEGHLKSTNHRKNAARIAAGQINREYHVSPSIASRPAAASASGSKKRKIEDVDEHDALQEERDYEVDGSKKPKSRAVSAAVPIGVDAGDRPAEQRITAVRTDKPNNEKHVRFSAEDAVETQTKGQDRSTAGQKDPVKSSNSSDEHSDTQGQTQPQLQFSSQAEDQSQASTAADINEDEWAAFESDMTTLAAAQQAQTQTQMQPSTSATITAAPLSADQIRAQEESAETQRKKLRDTEIEDEQEDETRRIEEEFEVMEEMEEKIRRLKEKRESLRVPLKEQFIPDPLSDLNSGGDNRPEDSSNHADQSDDARTGSVNGEAVQTPDEAHNHVNVEDESDDDDDDDDDDVDDWYS